MDYTLNQLRIFLKVVECQSVTKASEVLYLTQPAVSMQLKKFQEQFEVPLTEVVGRKLYITDFGKEIARSARQILEEIEAINYRTRSYKGQMAGKLKISTVSTGKYVMPYFISGFLHQHPNVDLVMDVTNRNQVVRDLEQNEVDFALVSVVPDHLKLQSVALLPNRLYLVCGTRLKPNTMPVGKLLEQYSLIYREQGSATRYFMEQFMLQEQWPSSKKIELTSNEAVKQALVAGLGYSILPLIGIKHELRGGDLEIIPYPGLPVVTHWHLVWQASKRLSPLAEAYLQFLQEQKEQIVREEFEWLAHY